MYGQLWLRVTHIAEDGRAEIVDIPTTLILKKGQEGIIISFAYKDGQYFLYDWLQPIAHQIIQDAGPKIVDIALMLIFRLRLGVCHYNSSYTGGQYFDYV